MTENNGVIKMENTRLSNTDKLRKLMEEYPDREVVFLYPEEGTESYYTVGDTLKIELDEYVDTGEQTWFVSDYDDLFADMFSLVAYEWFSYDYLDDQQINKVEKEAEERIEKMPWKKAIVVYIQPR